MKTYRLTRIRPGKGLGQLSIYEELIRGHTIRTLFGEYAEQTARTLENRGQTVERITRRKPDPKFKL
jgi:hypothetical protein